MQSTRQVTAALGSLAVTLFAAGADCLAVGGQPAQEPPRRSPQANLVPRAAPPAKADALAGAVASHLVPRRTETAGKDDRPAVTFFDARDRARSVVYAIDCSGSMATRHALDVAKRELLASLGQLPAEARFAGIFHNLKARILSDDQGHRGLMPATAANRERVLAQLAGITPDGGTDHLTALNAALALKPEVIFFLTDADLMTDGDVDEVLTDMGRPPRPEGNTDRDSRLRLQGFFAQFRPASRVQQTRIHVIEFGRGPEGAPPAPLRRLAEATGGSYTYLDVRQFPRDGS